MSLPPDDSEHDRVYETGPTDDDYYPEPSEDVLEFQFLYSEDGAFLATLENDVRACEDLLVAVDDGYTQAFARRTFVRTVFAQIEGLTASAFEWAKYYSSDDAHPDIKGKYTAEEKAVLGGGVPKLDEKGVPRFDVLKLKTRESVIFGLSLLGRQSDEKMPEVHRGDEGWDSLAKAIKIRDRLTHPKKRDDVVVTDEELATVRTGRKWYLWTYDARGGASRSPRAQPMEPDWRKWVDGLKAGWRVLR